MSKRGTLGFTLLEVLVALAIFATAAIAVTQVSMQYTRATSHAILRTQAQLLAMNQAALMKIQDTWIQGSQTESIDAFGESWQVVKSSESTISPQVRRISIQINLVNDGQANNVQGIHTLQYFHRKLGTS